MNRVDTSEIYNAGEWMEKDSSRIINSIWATQLPAAELYSTEIASLRSLRVGLRSEAKVIIGGKSL
jgi:hypothetical protein